MQKASARRSPAKLNSCALEKMFHSSGALHRHDGPNKFFNRSPGPPQLPTANSSDLRSLTKALTGERWSDAVVHDSPIQLLSLGWATASCDYESIAHRARNGQDPAKIRLLPSGTPQQAAAPENDPSIGKLPATRDSDRKRGQP